MHYFMNYSMGDIIEKEGIREGGIVGARKWKFRERERERKRKKEKKREIEKGRPKERWNGRGERKKNAEKRIMVDIIIKE